MGGLNQTAALVALQNKAVIETNIKSILGQRKELEKSLSELNTVVKIFPSEANFLLVEFEDAQKTYESLTDQKIIVRNRSKIINNCIRISVGSSAENKELLKALKQIEDEKSIVY